MKLGIFAPMLGRDSGGPGTYEEQLIRHLAGAMPESELHVWCSREGAPLLPTEAPNIARHCWQPRLRLPSVVLGMPWAMRRHRLDLAHATFVPAPWLPLDYVFTVHDLSPILQPEFYKPHLRRRLSYLIRRGIAGARVVLCISETTRAHVVEQFGVGAERLAVAYHGVDPRFCPGDVTAARTRLEDAFGLRGRYVLFLGKIEARKNIARLLEAFAALRADGHRDLTLVLAGRRHWGMQDIDQRIARLGLDGAVLETGYVPDTLVVDLYRAAEVMVFPSLWEGFGLPLIEAMACGTPVVTSNASCLPEIAGGAALEFDPLDVDAMAAALRRACSDDALRTALRERGHARARAFTWQATAAATVHAYQQALALA